MIALHQIATASQATIALAIVLMAISAATSGYRNVSGAFTALSVLAAGFGFGLAYFGSVA